MEGLPELLARSAAGDAAAFASVYDATCARLFRLVLLLVGEHTQAIALTQDVYLTRSSHRLNLVNFEARNWSARCTVTPRYGRSDAR